MDTKRNDYWDNIKAILIFLVVLGHFLLPASNRGILAQTVYNWIYIFHMPAFVFVSGVFSKSYVRKENKENRIAGFIVLYIGFTLAVLLIRAAFSHTFGLGLFIKQSGAPWYMLAMAFWYIVIPFASKLKPMLAFPMTIVLALIVGKYNECGDFLALSRTIVFFPFFLGGYYFPNHIQLSRSVIARVGGGCFLIVSALVLYYFSPKLSGVLNVMYANSPYSNLGFLRGIVMRVIWYFWSSCMTVALMCVVPRRRLFFTYIGERTLGIYILHRLIREVLENLHVYSYLGSNYTLVVASIISSVIVIYLASGKRISGFLNKAFRLTALMRSECQTNG